MKVPRLNAAYDAASFDVFLHATDDEVYSPLASPHGYTLAPELLSAWRLQLPVLLAALKAMPTASRRGALDRRGRRMDCSSSLCDSAGPGAAR
jgi:hypothetical protein